MGSKPIMGIYGLGSRIMIILITIIEILFLSFFYVNIQKIRPFNTFK